MKASSIVSPTGEFPAFNPSARQVLPASAAVKAPRFSTSKHWAISSTAREVLDSFDTPLKPAPRPEPPLDPAESIVLEGRVILNSLRTGSHVIKQRRTVDFETLPELSIVEPFAVVAEDSIRGAAAERLRQISTVQRPRVAPRPVAPAAGCSRVLLFAAGLVIGAFGAWFAARALQ